MRRSSASAPPRCPLHTPATWSTRPCRRSPASSPPRGRSWGEVPMGEFKMPSLGADMEAGTLIEWRIKPGDTVKRGDVVAVVDTSKAAIEVEIWEGGVVQKLVVEPGTRVPVGAVLAVIGGA